MDRRIFRPSVPSTFQEIMQLKLEAMGDSRSVWSVTDLERSKKNSIQNTPSFSAHSSWHSPIREDPSTFSCWTQDSSREHVLQLAANVAGRVLRYAQLFALKRVPYSTVLISTHAQFPIYTTQYPESSLGKNVHPFLIALTHSYMTPTPQDVL